MAASPKLWDLSDVNRPFRLLKAANEWRQSRVEMFEWKGGKLPVWVAEEADGLILDDLRPRVAKRLSSRLGGVVTEATPPVWRPTITDDCLPAAWKTLAAGAMELERRGEGEAADEADAGGLDADFKLDGWRTIRVGSFGRGVVAVFNTIKVNWG